jgi:hypothetical protein
MNVRGIGWKKMNRSEDVVIAKAVKEAEAWWEFAIEKEIQTLE